MKFIFDQANAKARAGDVEGAIALLEQVIASNAKAYEPHYKLGMLYAQSGRLNLSIEYLQKAIVLNHLSPEMHYNFGLVLSMAGYPEEALISYKKVLNLVPDDLESLVNLSGVLGHLGRYQDAFDAAKKAIALNESIAQAWFNRATAERGLGQLQDAVISYEHCLKIDPQDIQAWGGQGLILDQLSNFQGAVDSFTRALQIKPDLWSIMKSRGDAYYSLGNLDKAIQDYQTVLLKEPGFEDAWNNLAVALQDRGNLNNALEAYEKVLALDPNYPFARGSYYYLKHCICDWKDFDADRNHLERLVSDGAKAIQPFFLLSISDNEELIMKSAQTWMMARHPIKSASLNTVVKSHCKKIRIGYFSADFRLHAVAHLIAGLLESHDKEQFEIYGFVYGPKPQDEMSSRIANALDHHVDIRGMSDEDAASLARDLGIDIAVDLTGLTQHNRPEIFMHRAAPIQVNYLGYPGTIGYKEMDYLIADAVVLPPEHSHSYFEKIVYLPDTYQANDSKRALANVVLARSDFGLPQTGFVFCCFNNLYKITPNTFDIWMKILLQVEGSVLWLLDGNAAAVINLRREAEKRGVDPSRLVFAPRADLAMHLARHQLADLFIDSLPYCAHTTASDALWAGLPVLTCIGNSFAGRVAASLLHSIKIPELVAETLDGFERQAVELAHNPEKLNVFKKQLELNRLTTPLFDTRLFTRNIERAYLKMIERHQLGLPPDHLYIEPVEE